MKKAFTLIELLVVIAIIAILAAILFPVFAQAKLAAKGVASLSNIKQIDLAQLMYANDYDDDFVIQGIDETGAYGWQNSWIYNSLPYFKSYDVIHDSTDNVPLVTSYNSGPKFSYVGNGILEFSQAGNWEQRGVIDSDYYTGTNGPNWFANATITQSQVGHIADTIMFATRFASTAGGAKDPYAPGGSEMEGSFSPWDATINNENGVDCGTAGCALPGFATGVGWGTPPSQTYLGTITREYAGKSPVAYTDGHAKSMNPNQCENWTGYDNLWGQVNREGNTMPFQGQWDALRN